MSPIEPGSSSQGSVVLTDLFLLYRSLLEAQQVFGLDFDMEEFAQFGDDKTDYLDDEEEYEEVSNTVNVTTNKKKCTLI